MKKPFIITVDTEGDNIWASTSKPEVENAKYLLRFQHLCERFGFKPTYLTNYEMATSPIFVRFARDAIMRRQAEVGCHIHPWDSPPVFKLGGNDNITHPYLIEYPEEIIETKVSFQTKLLEDAFECKIVSHRAGRWAFNEKYANVLVSNGYRVDCSVTPGVSWASSKGLPEGVGGTDYRGFPSSPYYIDLNNISRPGHSCLLEVPVTIRPSSLARRFPWLYGIQGLRGPLNRIWPQMNWLRPFQNNLRSMLSLVTDFSGESEHLEFMMHSSELMPGGSPYFETAAAIDMLYENLGVLFEAIGRQHFGATLAEFADMYAGRASVAM